MKQTATAFAGLSIVPRHVLGQGYISPPVIVLTLESLELELKAVG